MSLVSPTVVGRRGFLQRIARGNTSLSLPLAKSYVFRGSKDYTAKQVCDSLGVGASTQISNQQSRVGTGAHRFLMPLQECEFALTSILEQLQRDPWPVDSDKRPQRCTGTAMNVAVSLLEVWLCGGVTYCRLTFSLYSRPHFPTRARVLCSFRAARRPWGRVWLWARSSRR